LTDVVVKEVGVVQPLGCETETLVLPVAFNVMGNVVWLLLGVICTVAGTVATPVLLLETDTVTGKPPARDCSVTGLLVLSSRAVPTVTVLIEPADSEPETLDGKMTTPEGANCTVPFVEPKLAVESV